VTAIARRRSLLAILVVIAAAAALAVTIGAQAAQPASYRACSLSESNQNPPGGTAAFALTVTQKNTSCTIATKVMKAFHGCRGDGGSRCGRRVLANWTCRGKRVAGGPRGLPHLFFGTFTCTSGERGVTSGYQELGPKCFGAAARDPKRPCTNATTAVHPDLDEVEPHALDAGAAGCDPGVVAGACVWGIDPGRATARVALVGDSHTYHWRAALALVAEVERWAGYSIDAGGCFFSAVTRAFLEGCEEFYQGTLAWFRNHPEVSTVFVTSNADTPVLVPDGQTYRSFKIDGFRRAWQALPKTVKHIIVLRDGPATTPSTFECVAKAAAAGQRPGPACPLARSVAIREDTGVEAVKELHAQRYQYIDMTHYFCASTSCYPVIDGARVNADIYGHLNVTYTRSLGPYLLRAIRGLEASW
jgi:hypothetical protein